MKPLSDKNRKNKKMILDSSFIELFYDVISQKCGFTSWIDFKNKKLSISYNKEIVM